MTADPIGRWTVIPASVPQERSPMGLKLDLNALCFNLENGSTFAVRRDAIQALLDAYDKVQARVAEYEASSSLP